MDGDDIINAIRSRHKSKEECDKGFGIDMSESILRNKDGFEMKRSVPSLPFLFSSYCKHWGSEGLGQVQAHGMHLVCNAIRTMLEGCGMKT